MGRTSWKERVVIDPDIHHGTPCIKGTRIPVSMIVGSLADEMSVEEIMKEYPQLTAENIEAALEYANEVASGRITRP